MRIYLILFIFPLVYGCNSDKGEITAYSKARKISFSCDSCFVVSSDELEPNYTLLCSNGDYSFVVKFYSLLFEGIYKLTQEASLSSANNSKAEAYLSTKHMRYVNNNQESNVNSNSTIIVSESGKSADGDKLFKITSEPLFFSSYSSSDTFTVFIGLNEIVRTKYFVLDK